MFKNVASQKFYVYAYDTATNAPKTGDSGNITAYIAKDFGSVTALTDTGASEIDNTNAKGFYVFDATQAETNADVILVSGKSSTSGVVVLGAPACVFTFPNKFTTLVIDSAGLADANMVKMGPTGSGAAQTARDVGASVLVSRGTSTGQISVTSGIVLASMTHINGDATAASNLGKTTRAIVRCTASGTPSTTSIPTSACNPAGAAADQFKGRIITFDADTLTTALRGQSTDITASTNSSTPTFTVTALTTPPVSTDTFSIT